MVQVFCYLNLAKIHSANLLRAKNPSGRDILPDPYREVFRGIKVAAEMANIKFNKIAGAKYPKEQIVDLLSEETAMQNDSIVRTVKLLNKADRDEIEDLINAKLASYVQ